MKIGLFFTTTLFFCAFVAQAQKSNKAYAITGKSTNNFFWADIKQIDIETGKVVKTLFESEKTAFKAISSEQTAERSINVIKPTELGVAACALDAVHNRLYFSPMHLSDIRYMDLNKSEATFNVVKSNLFPQVKAGSYQNEENQITRMVIAADGFGYALTNDAKHLFRFSTNKKAIVEDLGSLIDAENIVGFSVHNKCTSWGGDMLADAFGKLIVISANHTIYNIDVKSKVATYQGVITGLPVNYTTNGAAVNDDGDIVVSSANVFEGLYKLNFKDFKAVKIAGGDKEFNAADLANGNFLLQKEADAANKFDVSKSLLPSFSDAPGAKVFPNPVAGKQFNVFFEGQKPGIYTLLLSDLAGRSLLSKTVNIGKGNQIETINITNKTAKGTYLVKVMNANKQLAFSEKVVLQ